MYCKKCNDTGNVSRKQISVPCSCRVIGDRLIPMPEYLRLRRIRESLEEIGSLIDALNQAKEGK
jgi:hypothetical protein